MIRRWFLIVLLSLSLTGIAAPVLAQEAEAPDDIVPSATPTPPIVPRLQVLLPGFDGEDVVVVGTGDNNCPEGNICVRTIDNYLNAIYRWGVGAGVIFAIVLIMIGGVEWMVGSAIGTIDRAKTRIKNASLGLLFLLGASTILTFINPNITALNGLRLEIIAPADISTEVALGGAVAVEIDPNAEYTTEDTDCTVIWSPVRKDLLPLLDQVGCKLKETTGSRLLIASGLRDPEDQARLWMNNCYKRGNGRTGSFTCDPLTCNPLTRSNATSPFDADRHNSGPWRLKSSISSQYPTDAELTEYVVQQAKENTRQYCPHLTGFTYDMWCRDRPGGFVEPVVCHLILEDLMQQAGFYRIASEPWHFEYNGKTTSSSADGSWNNGTMRVLAKYCQSTKHGDDCVWDYAECKESRGGPGFANMRRACCATADGQCVN